MALPQNPYPRQIHRTHLSETYIKRVIELTEAKYCSTYATLRDVVEIIGNYEIVRVDEQ